MVGMVSRKAALLLPVCGHSAAWSQLHACPGNTTADDILAGIDLTGKRAVVTGGDSGLGYAIALAFARRGATVVIGTRDQNKGEAAARGIAGLTGVDVSAPWLLDLSSLSTVRSFVASFLGRFGSKLNFLINNAGIVSPSVIHRDGFELVFQVDYLGHFLLTELLLPALRNSTPSRIVNVASESHANACGLAGWPEGCFKDWTYLPPPAIPRKPVFVHYPPEGPGWIMSSSYGLAKFLQIQHSEELARREAKNGVKVFSVTPSLTWTSMTYWMKNQPWLRPWCRIHQEHPAPSLPTQACPFGAGEGAAVIAFCSTGDAKSGSYYSRGHACEERPVVDHGMTADMRSELYSKSLEWVGLKRQLPIEV